jgi:cyanate lyase
MFRKIKVLIKPFVRNYETITNKSINVSKSEVTERILTAKNENQITFEEIAQKVGKNKVLFVLKFTISIIYKQLSTNVKT